MVEAGWNAQAFDVLVDFDGEQVKQPVAGWVNGVWALDFRVFDLSEGWDEDLSGGWLLTHLPTGRRAFGIITPLDEAMKIADAINAMADWDFVGPTPPPSLIGIRQRVLEAFKGKLTSSPQYCRGPLMRARESADA